MKSCTQCKLLKEAIEFSKDQTASDGLKSYCKDCCKKYNKNKHKKFSAEQKARYNTARKEKYENDINGVRTKRLEYMETWRKNNAQKTLYGQARIRAAKRGLEFNIELSDVVIPDVCPILQVPLVKDGKTWFSPSLDRIDVTKGYIKGNVAVISDLANTMKNSATFEQLRTFNKNILQYIGDDIVHT